MKKWLLRLWPNFPLIPEPWQWPGLILLLFFGALFWAGAKDPYQRFWLTLHPPDGPKAKATIVLTKPARPMPVVFFVPGKGDSLLNNGNSLRQLAQMGLAVAGLDSQPTSSQEFDAQFGELLRYVHQQSWAKTNQTVWLGSDEGASRLAKFASNHPELQPGLMIQLNARWQPEIISSLTNNSALKGHFTFIQSEQDAASPLGNTKKLVELLQAGGIAADLKLWPGSPPDFATDQKLLFRMLGEKCLAHFHDADALNKFHSPVLWENAATSLAVFWIPALAWAGLWIYTKRRERSIAPATPSTRWERVLRRTAATLALIALLQIALRLGAPQLSVSEGTLQIAERFLILPEWKEDFRAVRNNPCWKGQKLKTLLTHVELSNYNRRLINWQVPDELYRNFVLLPTITNQNDEELNWRRPLWENFYPRIRKEDSIPSAAQIIVHHLRERVTISARAFPYGISTMWSHQTADEQGFALMAVASLRAAGIASRLDSSQRAEFWDGKSWQPAPSSVLIHW